jgi:ABC-2 type transport system permease protein
MNASVPYDGESRKAMAAPHATHKFKLMLKREFWEHKGGFFWAPLVAGAIFLFFTTMGWIIAEVVTRKAMADGEINIDDEVRINGLDLGVLSGRMKPDDFHQLGQGVDLSLLMATSWPMIVLGFVVFFYCLGALYDERKDRSVLFWKSLPLSDRDTVLSKVASALLVAPVLAVGAGIVTMFGFLLLASLIALVHGGNPYTFLWGPGSPLSVAATFIACLPLYALWALPTVGWLLLCSVWSRSKPFLWAVMIPLFAGIFVAMFDIMNLFNLDTVWFWKHIVFRALASVFPGMWMSATDHLTIDGPEQVASFLQIKNMYSVMAGPEIWIGAIAGIAMIYGAIRLRRWRDDN